MADKKGPGQPPPDRRGKTTASSVKIGRDAKSGQFVPIEEAKRRPSTTVIETIKKSPTPPKSSKPTKKR